MLISSNWCTDIWPKPSFSVETSIHPSSYCSTGLRLLAPSLLPTLLDQIRSPILDNVTQCWFLTAMLHSNMSSVRRWHILFHVTPWPYMKQFSFHYLGVVFLLNGYKTTYLDWALLVATSVCPFKTSLSSGHLAASSLKALLLIFNEAFSAPSRTPPDIRHRSSSVPLLKGTLIWTQPTDKLVRVRGRTPSDGQMIDPSS